MSNVRGLDGRSVRRSQSHVGCAAAESPHAVVVDVGEAPSAGGHVPIGDKLVELSNVLAGRLDIRAEASKAIHRLADDPGETSSAT